MAKKATADGIARDIAPPNYRGAVKLIRADLDKKKDRIAGLNSEIGEMWGKVEGYHVNKVAAKFFAKLDKLEPAERNDVLRSFNGLASVSDWPEVEVDLVDKAEGNVVHMRLDGASDPTQDDNENDDDETDDAVDDDAVDNQPGENSPTEAQANSFISKARGHLGVVKPGTMAPDAMDAPVKH